MSLQNKKNLSADYESLIKKTLQNDEEILKLSPTKPSLMFRGNDVIRLLFVFFIFSILLIIMAKNTRDNPMDLMIPLVICCIILIIFIRFYFLRYQKQSNLIYVVTNKRVIFLKKNTGNFRFISFSNIDEIDTEYLGDNKGYIVLGKPEEIFSGRGINFTDDEFQMKLYGDYKEVLNIIKEHINTAQNKGHN